MGFSVGAFMGFNVGSLDGAEVRSDTIVAAVVCSVDIAAVVTDATIPVVGAVDVAGTDVDDVAAVI